MYQLNDISSAVAVLKIKADFVKSCDVKTTTRWNTIKIYGYLFAVNTKHQTPIYLLSTKSTKHQSICCEYKTPITNLFAVNKNTKHQSICCKHKTPNINLLSSMLNISMKITHKAFWKKKTHLEILEQIVSLLTDARCNAYRCCTWIPQQIWHFL